MCKIPCQAWYKVLLRIERFFLYWASMPNQHLFFTHICNALPLPPKSTVVRLAHFTPSPFCSFYMGRVPKAGEVLLTSNCNPPAFVAHSRSHNCDLPIRGSWDEYRPALSEGEGRKSSWAVRNLDFRVRVHAVGCILLRFLNNIFNIYPIVKKFQKSLQLAQT